jgi:hypothetical protein
MTIPAAVSTGEPTKTSWANAIRSELISTQTSVSGLDTTGILNGNFEFDDGGGPPTPTNWTFATASGGSWALNTATPMSADQYLSLTTTATSGSEVSAESDKVKGGHFAVDVSLMYRTTATRSRFRVQLLEYNNADSLISTLDIADYAAGANISQDTIGLNINGLTGLSTQFSLKFILGGTGETTAGTVDIDAIIVKTRPDIISKRRFEVPYDSSSTSVDKGWIYLPNGTTTVSVDVVNSGVAAGNVRIQAASANGTNVAGNATANAYTGGVSVANVSADTGAGDIIAFFSLQGLTGGIGYTMLDNQEGFNQGLVLA